MAGIAGIGEVVLHTNLVHPGYRYDDAEDPEAVTRALIALHATDPASVYLCVLARSAVSTLADVADALYERRSLVRWMAMRRTLFVFPREDIPTVHPRGQHSAGRNAPSTPDRPAATQRERPRIAGNVGSWLADLEDRTEGALARRGTATGTQLAEDEPALKPASSREHRLISRRTSPLQPLDIVRAPFLGRVRKGLVGEMARRSPDVALDPDGDGAQAAPDPVRTRSLSG